MTGATRARMLKMASTATAKRPPPTITSGGPASGRTAPRASFIAPVQNKGPRINERDARTPHAINCAQKIHVLPKYPSCILDPGRDQTVLNLIVDKKGGSSFLTSTVSRSRTPLGSALFFARGDQHLDELRRGHVGRENRQRIFGDRPIICRQRAQKLQRL